MEVERKIRKVGNSLGVIMPADFLKYMGLKEGDTVYTTYQDEKIIISSTSNEKKEDEFKAKVFEVLDEYFEENKKK